MSLKIVRGITLVITENLSFEIFIYIFQLFQFFNLSNILLDFRS